MGGRGGGGAGAAARRSASATGILLAVGTGGGDESRLVLRERSRDTAVIVDDKGVRAGGQCLDGGDAVLGELEADEGRRRRMSPPMPRASTNSR